jgi:hypothetical protein
MARSALQIAAELDNPGARVVLVDQYTGFDAGSMLQPDGTHPTPAGEQLMADRWHAALEPILAPGAAAVPALGAARTAGGLILGVVFVGTIMRRSRLRQRTTRDQRRLGTDRSPGANPDSR